MNERHKLHHSYIWLRPVVVSLIVYIACFFALRSTWGELFNAISRGTLPVWQFVLGTGGLAILIFLLMLASHAISYRYTWYEFGDREFSYYQGWIFKKQAHIPYEKVQSVNHSSDILQRIAGVCTAKIDTASGAENKGVSVHYITLAAAEQMRQYLLTRKAQILAGEAGEPVAPFNELEGGQNVLDRTVGELGNVRGVFAGSAAMADEKPSFVAHLTTGGLVWSALANSINSAFLEFLGACAVVGIFGAFLLPRSLEMGIDPGVLIAIAITFMVTVGAILLIYVVNVLVTLVGYGRFEVRRVGSRIEIERGLLSRHYSGIELDRIQSVTVSQSFLMRCCGYAKISLGRVASTHENQQQNTEDVQGLVIQPAVKVADVPAILAGLVPEMGDVPADVSFETRIKHLPYYALRRAVIRMGIIRNGGFWTCFLVLMGFVVFYQVSGLAAGTAHPEIAALEPVFTGLGLTAFFAAFIFVIHQMARAVFWYRDSGYRLEEDAVVMRNGGFSISTTRIPRKKIQNVYTSQNPFQANFKVKSVIVTTAAGMNHTATKMWDWPDEDADILLVWLKPRHGAKGVKGSKGSKRKLVKIDPELIV